MDIQTQCESCRAQEARYVCRACGKRICDQCFSSALWLCRICSKAVNHSADEYPSVKNTLRAFEMKWFGLSFAIITCGMLLIAIGSMTTGNLSGGLVVFIGPLPIVFGQGIERSSILFLIIALAILTLSSWIFRSRVL